MLSAAEALQRLREGNGRFVGRLRDSGHAEVSFDLDQLVADQRPFAIVLGCSDSRAPVEIIFDQGPGDLFVVRVAGNIVAPSLIGSIEFAATKFDTGLVVVLGHSRCGAIAESLAVMRGETTAPSDNLQEIIASIGPTLESLPHTCDQNELARRATRANVEHSMRELLRRSEILSRLVDEQRLTIVGAEYALESGRVEFFADGA
ncbi:MAG: carbonic anhydrase [Gammaproteobacteria bacterium]|nr:carbonic anhydrase [Gammaproteobacteria bacterium]NNF61712.1 carbonic anhydrase [Gammaproteobacteria bacterium]NNM21767.1 carbonic anhydrase [Gammaproteobacteria bacterium]